MPGGFGKPRALLAARPGALVTPCRRADRDSGLQAALGAPACYRQKLSLPALALPGAPLRGGPPRLPGMNTRRGALGSRGRGAARGLEGPGRPLARVGKGARSRVKLGDNAYFNFGDPSY